MVIGFLKSIWVVNLAALQATPMHRLKKEDRAKKCPDCGSEDIGYDNGEHFCKKCGLVLD